ncbi:MAG: Fn3-like domain-containing protein [Candidatus Parcubacteria bacterium]|nr:Fn3-like domain-containing protein [Candidatus Parcubacteria bacterium]
MKTKKICSLVMVGMLLGILLPLAGNALTISPPILEIDAKKGDIINQVLKVHNENTTAETYYLSAVKFTASGETGAPEFVEGKTEEVDLAAWIKFGFDNISIQAGQTVEIPFTIAVPQFAGPGGHYAAIFLSSVPPTAKANVSQVGITSRLGALVLVKIAGEIKESAELAEFGTTAKSFLSLPVDFNIRVKNSGNVHLKPTGSIVIKNMFGSEAGKVIVNETGGNILPDQIRKYDASWVKNANAKGATTFWGKYRQEKENYAFGKYTADLSLSYGTAANMLNASTSFWVIPWHVIIVNLVVILLVVIIIYFLVKKYNAWLLKKYTKVAKAKK